jgi:hypothetical protein
MTQPKQKFASDYIDVATRIVEFREKFPDGSLQPADLSKPFDIVEIGGKTFIVVVAAAYRGPDDARPGIGMAYEQFPGATPFTRGSELQNAETSAWGRAIVAALAGDTKKGIASAEEVRNRQAENHPLAQHSWPTMSFIEKTLAGAESPAQIESIREKALVAVSSNAYTEVEIERIKKLLASAKERVTSSPQGRSVSDLLTLTEYIENVNSQEDYDTVKASIENSQHAAGVKAKLFKTLDDRADKIGSEPLFD